MAQNDDLSANGAAAWPVVGGKPEHVVASARYPLVLHKYLAGCDWSRRRRGNNIGVKRCIIHR